MGLAAPLSSVRRIEDGSAVTGDGPPLPACVRDAAPLDWLDWLGRLNWLGWLDWLDSLGRLDWLGLELLGRPG